ncbi:MAG TPA: D-alanyl-D-alanine carboxypeptidase family protein [Iamia sp.]|nr:D-alanyl-D-alanine carboxypeptidase family protein [Iamia sp.]
MPAPAAVAAVAIRHRRGIVVLVVAWFAFVALVVLGVMVIALGGTPPARDVPAAGPGIPPIAMDAYLRAAEGQLAQQCGVRWQILAGIARVESNHAAGRTIADDGTVTPAILGPTLDGSGGTASIADTDDGALDGDQQWDRAVGPFQFIPTSWTAYGTDGNEDGRTDPSNLYDASLGAVDHLCGPDTTDLADPAQLRAALLSYNRSDDYVREVIRWITLYDRTGSGSLAEPATPTGVIVSVRGIEVDQSIAPGLEQLLAAAEADDLSLSGGGWRSRAEQIALRKAHCGESHFAIYEMPSSQCSPPTAPPGSSKHERGLAVDFTHNGAVIQRGTRADAWLMANAPRYGLHNLPSEAWHYSVDGS